MRVAVILIGRNEAGQLPAAMAAARATGVAVCYVDSGSSDGSAELADSAGVDVVRLTTPPHSAAAGRNAGLAWAKSRDIDAVQFVDADCDLADDWLQHAVAVMDDAKVSAVVGQRREARPDASIFNRICDLEWRLESPDSFGGDVLLRRRAVEAAGGYDECFIASEDHDLAARLPGRVVRLDRPCTTHDARMTRVGQWWRREVRRGVGVGLMWAKHHRSRERRIIRRAAFWTATLPAAAVATMWTRWALVLLGVLWLFRFGRIARHGGPAKTFAQRLIWAGHCCLCVVPNAVGIVRSKLTQPRLIEYHRPT